MTEAQKIAKKRALQMFKIRFDFKNQTPWKERAKAAGFSEREIQAAEMIIREEFELEVPENPKP